MEVGKYYRNVIHGGVVYISKHKKEGLESNFYYYEYVSPPAFRISRESWTSESSRHYNMLKECRAYNTPLYRALNPRKE